MTKPPKSKKQPIEKPDRPEIDPKMLGVLVCPKTRGPLTYDSENNRLVSKKAKLSYPIREGVPILLIEEAEVLD